MAGAIPVRCERTWCYTQNARDPYGSRVTLSEPTDIRVPYNERIRQTPAEHGRLATASSWYLRRASPRSNAICAA